MAWGLVYICIWSYLCASVIQSDNVFKVDIKRFLIYLNASQLKKIENFIGYTDNRKYRM